MVHVQVDLRIIHPLPDPHIERPVNGRHDVADLRRRVVQVSQLRSADLDVHRGWKPGVDHVADHSAGLERELESRHITEEIGSNPLYVHAVSSSDTFDDTDSYDHTVRATLHSV